VIAPKKSHCEADAFVGCGNLPVTPLPFFSSVSFISVVVISVP